MEEVALGYFCEPSRITKFLSEQLGGVEHEYNNLHLA